MTLLKRITDTFKYLALPKQTTDFFQCCKQKPFCLRYPSASKNSENSNQGKQEHLLVYSNRLWQKKASSAGAFGLSVVM